MLMLASDHTGLQFCRCRDLYVCTRARVCMENWQETKKTHLILQHL